MKTGVFQVLLVGLGGMLGSIMRIGASLVFARKIFGHFPAGTFAVNIAGSLLIGMLMALFERHAYPVNWQFFLVTGFCGGFTTFSALSYESLQLIRQNEWGILILYVLLSVAFGVAAAAVGYMLFKH